jgi:hypothetical protein
VRSPECLAGRNKIALSELLVDLHGGIAGRGPCTVAD